VLKLIEPVFLLRANAVLPAGLKLTSRKFFDGWNCVTTIDARVLGKRLKKCGWRLVADARKLSNGGLGTTPHSAAISALGLALRQVSASFNAVRVEYSQARRYPWFFLATVAIFPQSIQAAELPLPSKTKSMSHSIS
jgi:hypothetical protein